MIKLQYRHFIALRNLLHEVEVGVDGDQDEKDALEIIERIISRMERIRKAKMVRMVGEGQVQS